MKFPSAIASNEIITLKKWAKQRDKSAKYANLYEKEGYSREKCHFDGLRAELAVARFLGCEYKPINDGAPDGGVDLVLGACTIQVKFNNYDYGDLYFGKGVAEFKADIAVLVTPWKHKIAHSNDVVIIGWADRDLWRLKAKTKSYGTNDVVAIEQIDLHDVDKLRAAVGRISKREQGELI